MKKIFCVMLVLLLLAGCSEEEAPKSARSSNYDVYRLTFDVDRISGGSAWDWEFVYTYKGKEIQSGYELEISKTVFSFYSIGVEAVEKGEEDNRHSDSFSVGMCDGGSGDVELTVTDSRGRRTVFEISCRVKKV